MTPIHYGPYAVFLTRTPDGWWRITALFQSRDGRRLARSCAGHCRTRGDAMKSVRAVAL